MPMGSAPPNPWKYILQLWAELLAALPDGAEAIRNVMNRHQPTIDAIEQEHGDE